MLASFDPVALDQACVDLCQQATPFRNSQLGDNLAKPFGTTTTTTSRTATPTCIGRKPWPTGKRSAWAPGITNWLR